MRPSRSDSIKTQATIISTAEHLFAERSIDGVSLSEINRAAGQRNKSALHYHFGDRMGLIVAMLEKHRGPLDDWRNERLDQLEPVAEASLRELVDVIVRPLARKLDDPDGGVEYIRISDQLSSNPRNPAAQWIIDNPQSFVARIEGPVAEHLSHLPAELAARRGALVYTILVHSLAARSYEEQGRKVGEQERELVIEDLIDVLVGMLTAPTSPTTQELLDSARSSTGALVS